VTTVCISLLSESPTTVLNKSTLDLEKNWKLRIIFFSSEQLYKEVRNGPIPAVMDWDYVKSTAEKFAQITFIPLSLT